MIFPRKRMCNELYSEAPIGTLHLISDTGCMKKIFSCHGCIIFKRM
jgi:hypothetical protein